MFTTPYQHLHTKPHCVVCGADVPVHVALKQQDASTLNCHAVHCKRVVSKKESMGASAFKHYLEFERKVISDRERARKIEKQRIDAIDQQRRDEEQILLKEAQSANPEAEKIAIITIPSGHDHTSPLNTSRIDEYRTHIKSLIDDAKQYASATEVPYYDKDEGLTREIAVNARLENNQALAKFSDRLCTQCKGGCCTSGRNHAYLTTLVIRQFMDQHPELNEQEVEQAYLKPLPRKSIEQSCINHSDKGCVLPRSMRSGICNSFYCETIDQYQKDVEAGTPMGHVLVIQRSKPYWDRYESKGCNEVTQVELVNIAENHQTDR